MSEILNCLLESIEKLPPTHPRQILFVSAKDDIGGESFYDKIKKATKETGITGIMGMPIHPVDFPITKTIDKTKKWKRQNRPPKTRVSQKEVPAFILMNADMLKMPELKLNWTYNPPAMPTFQEKVRARMGFRM